MIEKFLKINFWLESITESKPKEQRTLLSKIILNGSKLLCRYLCYWYLSIIKYFRLVKVRPLIDDEMLPIVSLTTFPKRFPNLWMVLFCIFNQTIRPAKIVVTLCEEEIPQGFKTLPAILRYFEKQGVEFLFVKENLRPHNKYFYCMQKYKNRDIITIDDDLLYYPHTIAKLIAMHKKYPKCICTNRGTKIVEKDGCFVRSNEWPSVISHYGPSLDIIALGYSAVYYPSSFRPNLLFDASLIKNLCLGTDDLWLRVVETLEGVKVVNGEYYAHPMTLPSSQSVALQKRNCANENNGNDINWKRLDKRFNLLQYYTTKK